MSCENRSYSVFAGRCLGCESFYWGEGLFYLYSDEAGLYCYDCGLRLVEECPEIFWELRDDQYILTVPAGLEGTVLHGRLNDMTSACGARVLVAYSSVRPGVRPASGPLRLAGAALANNTKQGR